MQIMFNAKTGQLGLRRNLGDAGFKDKGWGDGTKEWNSNYAVFPLDPVDFTWDWKNRLHSTADWRTLPDSDPRVQYMTLFDIIETADWHYGIAGGDDNCEVDEAYIENTHEVFRRIRKLFSS